MKSVKIQQELIKNYANYVRKPSDRTKAALPGFYSIKDGKLYLVYATHIFVFNEKDILVDLSKFTEIGSFRNDAVILKYDIINHKFPNSVASGIIKDFNYSGIHKQGVEIVCNECFVKYVDKKIFDYYECNRFFVADSHSPIYAIKDGTCIGMVLPLMDGGEK